MWLVLGGRPSSSRTILANRQQEPQLGVNNLKIAHVAKDKAAILLTALH
jgi:hypothetical protein